KSGDVGTQHGAHAGCLDSPRGSSTKSWNRGAFISVRSCSSEIGLTSGIPCLSRYQLVQPPVAQIDFAPRLRIASISSALLRGQGEIARRRARACAMHFIT